MDGDNQNSNTGVYFPLSLLSCTQYGVAALLARARDEFGTHLADDAKSGVAAQVKEPLYESAVLVIVQTVCAHLRRHKLLFAFIYFWS